MEVKLISYSQPVNSDGDKNPLSIAELAASVCYDSEPTDTYRIVKGCKATGHCYDEATEVFTSKGFVPWKDVTFETELAAIDPETRMFVGFERPMDLFKYDYDGDMIAINHKDIDLLITPGHKLYASISKSAYHRTHPSFSLIKADDILPTGVQVYKSPFRLCLSAYNPNSTISKTDLIYKLYGFFIGDGFADVKMGKYIHFHLKKQRKIDYLKKLCSDIGVDLICAPSNKYKIASEEVNAINFCKMFYSERREKTFPDEFFSMTRNQYNCFVDGLLNSDGFVTHTSAEYCTTSKELVSKLQALCSINGTYCSDKKTIKNAPNQKDSHKLTFYRDRMMYPMINDSRTRDKYGASLVHYTGKVYCATLSTGLLIVRRNGKVCLCGNCSVLEHISFTFEVSGVSRALLAQLSRHRHISLSVQSQRYVSMDNFDYVNPFNGEDADVFNDMMADAANNYRILKEYHNAANEDARAVLPNACCTKLYVTINARSLIEMSHLRLCTRAQSEIRSMFQLIKSQVATVCPELAAWMVPSCEANPKYPFCPEGNRCCGRHPKLADVYKTVEK